MDSMARQKSFSSWRKRTTSPFHSRRRHVLPLGAEDAGFGHQQNAVHVRLGAVAADHLQPSRGGKDVRLTKAEADPFAQLQLVAVGEEHGGRSRLAVDLDLLVQQDRGRTLPPRGESSRAGGEISA